MKSAKKNIPRAAKNYDHQKIEPKWRKVWDKTGLNTTPDKTDRPKFFILDMFPYPSGQGLHVGHPRGYIATDVYSRYKKMHGFNVLHPMGWDAFGLPAENYAIKNKTNPVAQTVINVTRYKEQMEMIGLNYDWNREINTTDPAYYKWTQWIFIQLLKKGLAYESFAPINWCPSCKTGLANEDLENGKCERCGSVIEKKPMRQWVLKITDYADRLLKDIDDLNWPESIKESQRNWIGRSEGAEFEFKIKNTDKKIKVFTTRADTLFGVTYVVLAPENSLVDELKPSIKNWSEIEKYRAEVKGKTEIERTAEGKIKTGVALKGISVINPANNAEVPVWVADYVLNDYGTGAVMAVPAHDERDFEFAKKYGLEIKQVIAPFFAQSEGDRDQVRPDKKTVKRTIAYSLVLDKKTNKFLCLDWGKFGWHSGIIGGLEGNESFIDAAKREIREETGYVNVKFIKELGGEQQNHFFAAHKDENRYGVGRGMLFELEDDKKLPVSEEDTKNHKVVWIEADKMEGWLNLEAFKYMWSVYKSGQDCYLGSGKLTNSGKFDSQDSEVAKKEITKAFGTVKISYKLKDWVFSRQRYWGEPIPVVHCERCGVVPVPEKELPVVLPKVKFYEPTGTGESPLANIEKWVNTKCPKCKGKAKRETNTMPQWAGSSWYYLRYMDPKNSKALVDSKKEKYWAPVDLYVGGTEHATRHLIYARFWHKFLYDIGVVSTKEPFIQLKNQGMILGSDNRKMSKRWGNVINPDDVVKNVGADTLRVYEMFMGPFEQEISWSTDNMVGSRRFLERVWKLQEKISDSHGQVENKEFEMILHRTIKKVTEDIIGFNFNTVISALMILINAAEKVELSRGNYEIILKLLAPFAPHITEEIWANLGNKKSIHIENWPDFDPKKIVSDNVIVVVQINGKPRANFEIAVGTIQKEVEKVAYALPEVSKWLAGKQIKKVMFIKEKILSIITD